MEKHPLSESVWRRGWQDTKAVWKSWQFYVFDALGGVIVGGVFEWYWGLALVVFGMICVWMGATARAPVKQRNEARQKIKELEGELKKPKLFDVECRTATKMLPIKLKEDGTWEAYANNFSPAPINIIHRGDLITVTSVTMALVVLFNHMDGGLETTDAITVTPQRRLPAFLSAPGTLEFEWDISNPLQWTLKGLPLTMRKDEYLPLPAMNVNIQDVNLVGEHFTQLDWCRIVISLRIRTDKGSPHIPDLFIELTSSDIPNPNPRYYWEDITNEPKD